MRIGKQKGERLVAKPSIKESLKMFGNIPKGNASMGQCKCCYNVCNRCSTGNEVDIGLLTIR
jgi:hypothetical protein